MSTPSATSCTTCSTLSWPRRSLGQDQPYHGVGLGESSERSDWVDRLEGETEPGEQLRVDAAASLQACSCHPSHVGFVTICESHWCLAFSLPCCGSDWRCVRDFVLHARFLRGSWAATGEGGMEEWTEGRREGRGEGERARQRKRQTDRQTQSAPQERRNSRGRRQPQRTCRSCSSQAAAASSLPVHTTPQTRTRTRTRTRECAPTTGPIPPSRTTSNESFAHTHAPNMLGVTSTMPC
eukprot:3935512-Rhodomonas_salina.3